jgi:dTDP-4-dehydrorhamnose reductase
MNAIILAAGQGTRLGDLTNSKPKCLLDFGSETILDRQLRILEESGIPRDNIYIVGGYKAEQLKEKYHNIILNNDYYKTDNSYSLGLALSSVYDDDAIIIDGDLIFQESTIRDIINSKDNLLVCKKTEGEYESTGVVFNQNGDLSGIGKHIKNSGSIYLSIFKLNTSDIPIVREELLKSENMRTWYTVGLNRLLNKIRFTCHFTDTEVYKVSNYYNYIEAKDKFNIKKCRALLTGASGFLGRKLYSILSRDLKIVGLQHNSFNLDFYSIDITNFEAIASFIELNKPDIIIHAAAIPDPDYCEKDNNKAYEINVTSTEHICKICSKKHIKLIFLSTDYVFDGDEELPYKENSERKPKNYYGYTKCLAEDAVRELQEYLIIRIPILYGYNDVSDKKTFTSDVIEKLSRNEELLLDNTQIRYPVLIDEISLAIKELLPLTGIIHLSSKKGVTKYQWAQIVAREYNFNAGLIHLGNDNLLVNRPHHIRLDTKRMDDLNIKISDVDEGIRIMKNQSHCAFQLIYKGDATEQFFNTNVAEFRYNLGKLLGKNLEKQKLKEIDFIVPIPNSGQYYAMGLAAEMNVPYVQSLIKEDPRVRSFNISNISKREGIISSKILPVKKLLENKRIILVDEAVITGTTLRVTCDMLKACDVREIHVCIPTPISFHRCDQYIQPNRKLLTEDINSKELAEYFRVDSITFLSEDNFIQLLGEINSGMCYKCFVDR